MTNVYDADHLPTTEPSDRFQQLADLSTPIHPSPLSLFSISAQRPENCPIPSVPS